MSDKVFWFSLLLVAGFVALGLYDPAQMDAFSNIAYHWIIANCGWLYMMAVLGFLVFVIVLAFSRYGNIKLGEDDEKPDYSYLSWFAMLFAAGLGIGLLFFGVAEPLHHFSQPPEQISPASGESAAFAMQYCFFHWGIHGWAVYAVMALAIAYFSFRRRMPPSISSCFYPLLGERIYSWPGHLIDISAVFATVFGVVTSLGFGAMQINSGLHHLYGIPTNTTTILIIIAVVTVLFLASSISGVDKGIQILSRFNFLLAALALLFILFLGPTSYILDVFVSSLGRYVNHFVEMSLATYPFQGQEWAKNWTIFYWAWWIAWAPFVGLFVARISRGRTIKEFVLGVLLVPSLLVFLWFSAFGGSALHLQLQGVNIAQVATADAPIALFVFFDHFPLGDIMSALTSVLLVVFFVTSADSATYVLGMLTSQGNLFPPTSKKVIWGLAESLIAALLLLAGGLEALQQMVINAALPFTFVMVLLCYNLWRGLAEETAPTELWLSDL